MVMRKTLTFQPQNQLEKLNQVQEIALAIFQPGHFDLSGRSDTVDGPQLRQVIFFKDHTAGFENGHFGLEIVNDPGCLGVGSTRYPLRWKEDKAGSSATAVGHRSWCLALCGQPELFSIEALGSFHIGGWQRWTNGMIC